MQKEFCKVVFPACPMTIESFGPTLPLPLCMFAGSGLFSDLNEEGVRQAELLAKRLQGESIELVLSSPLERAKRTATAVVVAYQSQIELKLDDNLKEVSWGDWEGQQMREEALALAGRWREGFLDGQ